jgi:hypothetical protein
MAITNHERVGKASKTHSIRPASGETPAASPKR